MIQFQAKYLPALVAFMAKNDIRYYLNGISIRRHPNGGVVLAATDGHRMLLIRDSDGSVDEDIIFRVAPGMANFCKKPDAIVRIDRETQLLTVFQKEEELYLMPGKCIVEGIFPDYRRVVPNFEDLKLSVAGHLNTKYLADAALAHPGVASKRSSKMAIRLWQASPTGAVVVEYNGFPEYCAVIMTMHCDVAEPMIEWGKNWGQNSLPGITKEPA